MKGLLTFNAVARELHVAESRLNYILRRDGIVAAERSGRGRGGERMFTHTQLKDIKGSLAATRQYAPRYKSAEPWVYP